jgi:tryptophan-rich sensory protein
MTGLAALAASAGTTTDTTWYRTLGKPSWQPPPAAFPLVWTPLYGLIAWGTGRLVDRAPDRGRALAVTAADLAVNAGWCWVFFKRRSAGAALATIAALDALNAVLLRKASHVDRRAALALVPYAAWTGFATALNASIWWRNRSR